jgi:addiction module HigA family antidote
MRNIEFVLFGQLWGLIRQKLLIITNGVWRKEKIMVRIPTNRTPSHPGEMLLEEFLNPMGLTQRALADAIHVPYQRVNDIVNGRRGITPSTALRLAKYFNMTPDFWMNVQLRWDMYFAQQDELKALESIQPLAPMAG